MRDAQDRQLEQSARICELNDALRTSGDSGQLIIARGIAVRGSAFVKRAVSAVRSFNDFTEDNDPYGEHDFGSFRLDGADIFWKIDLYERELVKQTSTGTPCEHRLIECTVHQCRVYPNDLPEPGCTRYSSFVPAPE